MGMQIVKLTDPIRLTNVMGGLVPKGAYNGATDYAVGDSVDYNGSSYVMHTDAAAGTVPTNTTYWQVLANKGDTGAKGDTGDTGPAGADGADGADGLTVSVNSVTQVAGNITLDQDDIPDGTTNKAYTAAEQTKLSGIEALADVTDATNVAAAGAVMDGDFSSNGVMTRTASGTYANRTLTGTANQITVTNGDGVSGNPTLSLPQDIHTGASPTFSNATATNFLRTNKSAVGNSGLELYIANNYRFRLLTTSTAESGSNVGSDLALYTYTDAGAFLNTALTITRSNSLITLGGALSSRAIAPDTDSTRELGTSSLYWSNTYTDRLYLNSTAYIDGATAGQVNIVGTMKLYGGTEAQFDISSNSGGQIQRFYLRDSDDTFGIYDLTNTRTWLRYVGNATVSSTKMALLEAGGLLGIGTAAPTHTLTLPSTSTGIAIYNTADQTTNYERIKMFWASSIFRIYAEQGGSGTNRQILISALGLDTLGLYLNTTSTAGIVESRADTATAGAIIHRIKANTLRGASGTQHGMVIDGTIDQTSTAGYTMLKINPTEAATGSGTKLLIDAQVGGVSKFKVDNTGKITSPLAQTYTTTNVTTDRSYDANATTLDEVADVLGTLIADLKSLGLAV